MRRDRKPSPASPVGELLRYSRERIGLNLRKIHEMSLELAVGLQNDRYRLALGTLANMENENVPPRHIEKIFSVCILYFLDLWDLLRAVGIPVEDAGQEPLPPQHPYQAEVTSPDETTFRKTTLADHLANIVEEIPLFLQHGFPFQIAEQQVLSGELYWFGRNEKIFHPLLNGAVLLAVDAAKTRDIGIGIGRHEPWERPLYLVMRRDEKYLCGFCAFKDTSVTLVPHPHCPLEPVHFVNGKDAEVVGRVTAIARILPRTMAHF